MKTILPLKCTLSQFFCSLSFLLFISNAAISQSFKGRDGAKNYSSSGTYILNRYTALASSVSNGAVSLTVADINQLSGATSFTNSANPYTANQLRAGDLIMVIQMQGVDINTEDNSNYGAITSYNGTGNYELRQVYDVSANTIHICQGLSHSYTESGRSRTQVVRIPRLSTLTIGASAIVTGATWSGVSGGIVALEVNGSVVIDGMITASSIGFRGGVDDKNVSSTSGAAVITLYRSTSSTQSGSKGEGIAGNPTDYNTYLNGNYGRGAPANGGGGGNGHNSGGGGGSNAGNNGALVPYNGTGIKSATTAAWTSAWNLESAGFATDVSVGGGRGGYSYSNSNQDALTLAPGHTSWGGDKRQIVGGFGGRPLDYTTSRLFMGGGGGAGEGNNNSSGDGGNGAGIAYLLVNGNISGTGTITANGQNGFNTQNSIIDAAGGAGGGGAILANASGTITGISMQANGGRGGDQLYLTGEAEGPGGGGGGGYIATTATSISKQVLGGDNGISYSTMVTEFLPNGATIGAAGSTGATSFSDVSACDLYGFVLPVKLISFAAILREEKVGLNWATANEEKSSHFELERSFDGQNFKAIATIFSAGNSTSIMNYGYNDNLSEIKSSVIYYRLKMVDTDKKSSYSETRVIRITSNSVTSNALAAYPNPASSDLRISIPASWQNKKVRFELYDVNGKLAKFSEKSNAVQTETINVRDISAGVYIVRATMGNETAQQRMVKK